MMSIVKSYVRRQQYAPGWAGLFLNPFYHSRRGLYETMGQFSSALGGRVLDVGCGRKPYRNLFRVEEYVGLEFDTPANRADKAADIYYDGTHFPFSDAEFDGIVCNQVLEHVFTPDRFLGEIHRVMKSDGRLLLSIPFVWDEHEQPYDYARYSSFGIRYLLERNGFEVIEHKKINADIRVVFQLINAYLYKVLWTRWKLANLVLCMLLMSPFNMLGAILGAILPNNPDLYLDQLVLVRKRDR